MTDHIRAKLEALITDSGMFNAGQQEERRRLQTLVDARIDQLRVAPAGAHVISICNELLRLRQSFDP
jgi:hypothetical protein